MRKILLLWSLLITVCLAGCSGGTPSTSDWEPSGGSIQPQEKSVEILDKMIGYYYYEDCGGGYFLSEQNGWYSFGEWQFDDSGSSRAIDRSEYNVWNVISVSQTEGEYTDTYDEATEDRYVLNGNDGEFGVYTVLVTNDDFSYITVGDTTYERLGNK